MMYVVAVTNAVNVVSNATVCGLQCHRCEGGGETPLINDMSWRRAAKVELFADKNMGVRHMIIDMKRDAKTKAVVPTSDSCPCKSTAMLHVIFISIIKNCTKMDHKQRLRLKVRLPLVADIL